MIYVSDLMTSRVFTLRRTDTLQDVRSLMQLAKIRHIPVTEDGDRFVGLLTHRDLLGYAVSHLAEINREEQEEIESSILVGDISLASLPKQISCVWPSRCCTTPDLFITSNRWSPLHHRARFKEKKWVASFVIPSAMAL